MVCRVAGGCQGCPLTTIFCIVPYHETMHHVQKLTPNIDYLMQADDTYAQADWQDLYEGFPIKKHWTSLMSGHESNDTKVVIFYDASQPHPLILDSRWKHTTEGFKTVGTYIGTFKYRSESLELRIKNKMAVHKKLIAITPTESMPHALALITQIAQQALQTVPDYTMRTAEPEVTKLAAEAADEAMGAIAHHLIDSKLLLAELDLPETHARLDVALQTASLPKSKGFGGCNLGGHARTRASKFVGSLISVYPRLQQIDSMWASINLADSTLPIATTFRHHYEKLSALRDDLTHTYNQMNKNIYHTLRGGKLSEFQPTPDDPGRKG